MRRQMSIARFIAWVAPYAIVVVFPALAVAQTPLNTSFTYQGVLRQNGSPVNGNVNLEFRLFNALSRGSQVGSTISLTAVPVIDGLFTRELNFGATVFNGEARWLQVTVDGVVLAPRTSVSAVPYALQTRGLYVNASTNVGVGTLVPVVPLHVDGGTDVSPTGGGAFQVGGSNSQNIAIDGNEIMARNNSAISALALNAQGGNVTVSGSGNGFLGVGTNFPKRTVHVDGDYYGLGHLWLHAFEGDGNSGTAYVQARDDSGSSSIGMLLRTQLNGNYRDAIDILSTGYIEIGGPSGAAIAPPRVYINGPFEGAINGEPLWINKPSGTGGLIIFRGGGTSQGSITISGATVSYNAFTGSHYAMLESDEAPAVGTLMRMTGRNARLHDQPEGEMIYAVEPSFRANDPSCLGAYLGAEREVPESASLRLIAAVGNGDLWISDNGTGDIEPGDYLISSDVAGCAMKDDSDRFAAGHVIARAAQRVEWNAIAPDAAGIRRVKASVLFSSFVRSAPTSNDATIIAELQRTNAALLERITRLERLVFEPQHSND